jgi:hypothetical protein
LRHLNARDSLLLVKEKEFTMTYNHEEWKPVVGFEDRYKVSIDGTILSFQPCSRFKAPRIKKPRLGEYGYYSVALWRDGIGMGKLVHCLVAEAFIGPKPNGMQVNHIDGIKTNNSVLNLEYITPLQNSRHAVSIGLMPCGERAGAAKLTEEKVRSIREAEGRLSQVKIAVQHGISPTAVWKIQRRQTWKHVL